MCEIEGSADLAYDGRGRVMRPHLLNVSETSSLCSVKEEQSGLVGRQSLTTGCQVRPRSREYSNSTAAEKQGTQRCLHDLYPRSCMRNVNRLNIFSDVL